MQYLTLAAAMLAMASGLTIKTKQIEYGFCDGSTEGPIKLEKLSIDPYPIKVVENGEINLDILLNLLEDVPVGAKISLKIVKKGTIIDLPIPCIPINDLHIGSCTYEAQHLLDKFADVLCPDYFPENQECTLPLKPGKYGGLAEFVLPSELPEQIVNLLAHGTFRAEVHAIRPDGSEETCLYAVIEVTNK